MNNSHASSYRTMFSAAFATLIEWFDFTIYIYIASYISQLFFPPQEGMTSLLETFGIFAAGYVMRPLGGIFFGSLGDKIGRKKTIILTVICMGVSMLMTCCLPTYERIGPIAPVLLLFARMLQGFSVGGEQIGVIVMLIEHAHQNYRGLCTSIVTFISGNGVLLSSLTATLLIQHYSREQMLAFGWRIPYIIACVLTVIVLCFQFGMKESPYYEAIAKEEGIDHHPMRNALRYEFKAIAIVFLLAGYLGVAYYLNSAFLPNYLESILGRPKTAAMIITTVAAFTYAYTAPIWGWLSDVVGRKPVFISGALGLLLMSYPLFLMLESTRFSQILFAAVILMLFVSICTPPFVTTISELFPTQHRYSGVSLGYNIANAIFGGTTPLIATALISLTGNALAPCWYLMALSCLVLIVLTKMPETRNSQLQV